MPCQCQVPEESMMPPGICSTCYRKAIAAIRFRQFVLDAFEQWAGIVESLADVPQPCDYDKAYYLFYDGLEETLVRDQSVKLSNMEDVVERLNNGFQEKPAPVLPLSAKQRKCPDCKKTYATVGHLNEHLKETKRIVCIYCAEVLSKTEMAAHVKTHNSNFRHCEICSEFFSNEVEHQKHINIFHASSEDYICTKCYCDFPDETSFQQHGHNTVSCSLCNTKFESLKCLDYHKKQCSRLKKKQKNMYVCDHCGMVYHKKPSLKSHVMQKHLKVLPFSCAICGKRTSTLVHLKSHELTHANERKVSECHCGAKFKTQLGYDLHLRNHSGYKPHTCEVCGDTFISASRRSDHIKRKHMSSANMAHGCHLCTLRFVRPFELRKHYLYAHEMDVDVLPVTRGRRLQC